MKNYFLTEEEYFEYYQNSHDPTFELYPFPEKEDALIKVEINWAEIPDDLDVFLDKSEEFGQNKK